MFCSRDLLTLPGRLSTILVTNKTHGVGEIVACLKALVCEPLLSALFLLPLGSSLSMLEADDSSTLTLVDPVPLAISEEQTYLFRNIKPALLCNRRGRKQGATCKV